MPTIIVVFTVSGFLFVFRVIISVTIILCPRRCSIYATAVIFINTAAITPIVSASPLRSDIPNMQSSLNLRQVADALPKPAPRLSLSASPHQSSKRRALELPECFATILRRVTSTHPHHRRQRATLESVALTLPETAASLTGSSAAAAYLAALVTALNRLVSTTEPVQLSHSRVADDNDTKTSKKQARKARLEQSRQQEQVKSMSVHALVAPETSRNSLDKEVSMNDEAPTAEKDDNDIPQTVGVITSFISLISLAVNGCSHAVINLKADTILQSIVSAYNHTSGYVTVAHHSNTVFAAVLSVLNPPSWSSVQVQTAFLYLLRHTADVDEAFRFNSQKALLALLHCPRGAVISAKASAPATIFFVAQLQQRFARMSQDDVRDRDRTEALTNLLHYIESVEQYASFLLPRDAVRISTELLVIALKDIPQVSAHAYSTLGSLFSLRGVYAARDEESDNEQPLILQNDISKLSLAIMNHQLPEDCPNELIIAYTTCVASAAAAYVIRHEHFSPADDFILKPVHCLFEAISLSSGSPSITQGISRAFQVFLGHRWFTCKPSILAILHKFIELKYSSVWSNVIPVLRKYLENGMCAGNEQMRERVRVLITDVVKMRQKGVSDQERKLVDVAESILKSISRGGGAALILNRCPIIYDIQNHVTNGWVLAVLRENVVGTALSSFVKFLVPVAQKLDVVMQEKLKDKRVVEAKNIGIYKTQIWSLLPGFCTKPSDLLHEGVLTLAFKAIYSCFTVHESQNLFPIAVSALRQLAASISALDNMDPMNKDKVQGFAMRFKKLFPTLVTSVAHCTDEKRSPLLDSICAACKATQDPSLVSTLLRKSIRQLLELQLKLSDEDGKDGEKMTDEGKENIKKQQHSTADLAIAITESNMVPAGAAEIGYLEKAMSPFFLDKKEGTLQKKAYRVSAMLITSGVVTKDHDKFMEFVKNTSEAHSSLAAGAKAARLAWITAIVNQHLKLSGTHERTVYLESLNSYFLSEIILSTRDSSEKTRSAAFETLVNMARGSYNLTQGNDVSTLQKFILSLCAGLGGKSPTMLAGTLSSLGKLIETFRYEIAGNDELRSFVDSLFTSNVTSSNADVDDVAMETNGEENNSVVKRCVEAGPVAILMRHNSVEVQRAAVAIVKTATKICTQPEGRLLNIVPGILPGLLHVAAGSNKRETRLRVRLVLERLLRKCGNEQMEAMFPEEHKKLLVSVRRQFLRERNKKLALRAKWKGDDDTDNDDDDVDNERKLVGRKAIEEEEGYIPDDSDDSDDSDVEKELVEGEDTGMKDNSEMRRKEGDKDVVDLLESQSSLAIATPRKPDSVNIKKLKRRNIGGGRMEVKYSDDGKPIFVESDDGSGGAEAGSVESDDSDDDSDREQTKQKRTEKNNKKGLIGKRRLGEEAADSSSQRHAKKLKGSFGEEFRSKRGGGDVKRANRPDPFAYVPLGPSMFAAGKKPGSGSKHSKGTALHRVASRSQAKKNRARGGGRSGLPARR